MISGDSKSVRCRLHADVSNIQFLIWDSEKKLNNFLLLKSVST